jgi:nitrogen fixation protein FixH
VSQAATGVGRHRDDRAAGEWSLSGRKVLAILVLFFGTVFSVNALMAYYALSTFRGEVADHPYEAGLAFNAEIAAARRQEARNWRVGVNFVPTADGKRFEVSARDSDGRPISGLHMTGVFAAPVDATRDRRVELIERQPGEYTALVPVAGGYWDVEIAASRDGAALFQSKSRVLIE